MKTSLRLLIAIALLVPAFAAAKQPEPFAPKDGRFTVKFPGKPKEITQTAKSDLGDLKVFTATYALPDASVFLASYTDFPAEAVKKENLTSFFDGVREGLKGKDGAVLTDEESPFGADKLLGREIVIDKGKLQVKMRVVLRDARLYQIGVIGTKEFVTGKVATTFLDSFEITK